MSTNNPQNSSFSRKESTQSLMSTRTANTRNVEQHVLLMGRRIIGQEYHHHYSPPKDNSTSTNKDDQQEEENERRGPEVIAPFSNPSHQQAKKRIRASTGFQVNLSCSDVYDDAEQVVMNNSKLLCSSRGHQYRQQDDEDDSSHDDLITPLDSKLPSSCSFPLTQKRIKPTPIHKEENHQELHAQNLHTKYLEINSTTTSCAPSIIEHRESPQPVLVSYIHLPSDIIEIIFNFMDDSSRKVAEMVSIDFHRACLQVEKRDLIRFWEMENFCLLKPLKEDTVSPILITQLERKFQFILPYHLKTFLIELSDGRASWHNKFLHVSNMLLPLSEWKDEGEQVRIGGTLDGSTLLHLCKQNGSLWFKHTKHSEIVNFKNWIQMKKKHFYHVHYNISSVEQRESLPYSFHAYRDIPSCCNFKTIVKAMVTQNGGLFMYANDTLKGDEDVALCAIQSNSSAFHECSVELKDNPNIAKAAVTANGYLLQNISTRLRDEFDIVKLALHCRPMALQYASSTLKNDPTLAYLAATTCGDVFENALQFAGQELRANRDFMAKVLKVKGNCLKYASDTLKEDIDIALLAVNQKGTAIQYVAPSLKRDLAVVSAAILQDARSLKYIPESIKSQKQFVLDMIELNPKALEFVPDHFRHDREVVLNAVQRDGMTLYFASKTLRGDLPIVLAAISQNIKALQYATTEVQHEINQQ